MANRRRKRPDTPRVTKYSYATEGIVCQLAFEKKGWAITINYNTPDNRYAKPETCLEEMVANEVMVTWGVDSDILRKIPLDLANWKEG